MGCRNSKYAPIPSKETPTELKDNSVKETVILLTEILGIQRSLMHLRYRETHLLRVLKQNIPNDGWIAVVFRPLDSPIVKHPPVVYDIDQGEGKTAISVISISDGKDIIMLSGISTPTMEGTIQKLYYSNCDDFVHELKCNWVERDHFKYTYPTPRFHVTDAEISCTVYHRRFTVDFTNTDSKPFDWERYAGY